MTFTWHDLAVITRHLPRESALARSILGNDYEWTLANHLRAAEVDESRVANWLQTEDGRKGKNPPKPIKRPGVEPEKQYGKDAISVTEMADWLGWTRELEHPEPVKPVDKTN